LILVGGFAYLYFFTGLIRPQEAQKAAATPVVASAPQVVKMPLPPREGEVAMPAAAPPVKVAPTPPAAKPLAVAPSPAKPVVAPVTALPDKAAPIPPAAKAKEEVKKSAQVKPAEKPPLPVAGAVKKAAAAPAVKPPAKKAAEAAKKSVPAKAPVKKVAASGTAKARTGVKIKPVVPDSWTLIVGNYVLEEALSVDLGRVRKSGLVPVVKPGSPKKTVMNRLLVGEFSDRTAAQATFEKLQRLTSDAFVMPQGGKFAVFAGSYLKSDSAASEKERLKAAGFPIKVKYMELAIPSQTLSVGPFTSKKEADAGRGKLQRAGMKVTLSQP
jgi:cell division protein FtsN